MSFKVAPGVRIRASSRGISAGVGPRAARVHVGTRGVGVSSGRAAVPRRNAPSRHGWIDSGRNSARLELALTTNWCLNEPDVAIAALERAFADNEAPAAPIDCEGDRTTVVMEFQPREAIVPERKPARTPTGKPTLKKRTKTEINRLYLEALGSNVLATVKETFAVAPIDLSDEDGLARVLDQVADGLNTTLR